MEESSIRGLNERIFEDSLRRIAKNSSLYGGSSKRPVPLRRPILASDGTKLPEFLNNFMILCL
jgi:hypothetical protein